MNYNLHLQVGGNDIVAFKSIKLSSNQHTCLCREKRYISSAKDSHVNKCLTCVHCSRNGYMHFSGIAVVSCIELTKVIAF